MVARRILRRLQRTGGLAARELQPRQLQAGGGRPRDSVSGHPGTPAPALRRPAREGGQAERVLGRPATGRELDGLLRAAPPLRPACRRSRSILAFAIRASSFLGFSRRTSSSDRVRLGLAPSGVVEAGDAKRAARESALSSALCRVCSTASAASRFRSPRSSRRARADHRLGRERLEMRLGLGSPAGRQIQQRQRAVDRGAARIDLERCLERLLGRGHVAARPLVVGQCQTRLHRSRRQCRPLS